MSYTQRADQALDALLDADTSDPMQIMQATVALARVVRDIAINLDKDAR